MAAFPRQTQFCMKAGDWSREAANIFAILFIFEEEYSLGNFEKYHLAAKFYPPFLLAKTCSFGNKMSLSQ